ncbi:hypothetical protein LSH36_145g05035 [Paralvinella palmiformis]|uniref:Nucleolar protein 4 helical domain-containing protein n=1 Tax=Paralvinella palmiformis TaxID=53620 RepID=A0AAD9JWM5_9ANNE|nr:hypothetical protein LSH36_145g05035 [Paralvinella palmiformis]
MAREKLQVADCVGNGINIEGLREHESTSTPTVPTTEMNGSTSPIDLHKQGGRVDVGAADVDADDDKRTTSSSTPPSEPIAAGGADGNGTSAEELDDVKPLNMTSTPRPEVRSHNDRKRRASSDSLDSLQTKASESAADDASKDDDEEIDDDDDDKMSTSHDFDPERLKAFNMFVRLFVDENLDRIVPISKQPKDKIQAILDACDRQFPEFHERSRKRIRTYLKSCRRMRRSKDTNGWDQLRPTPPHLTSAAAESILALACENESNNAKRMRMGLEPLPMSALVGSQSAVVTLPAQPTSSACASPTQAALAVAHAHGQNVSPPRPPSLEKQTAAAPGCDYQRPGPGAVGGFRAPQHDLPSAFFTNANGIFRPGFSGGGGYQSPAHHHNTGLANTALGSQIQNGPTDLSMKKGSLSSPSSKNQLNSTEVATIKQLIAGYRESAAFLYRSADELEQLLLHQN